MSLILRDAQESDLPALTAIRAPEALHRGRLRDARLGGFRYCVIEQDEQVIGFVSLVMRRPDSWSNRADTAHLPEINDLYIEDTQRGRGYGTAAIHALEGMAAQLGHRALYISVEPLDNPRAYALYQRLDYRPLQSEAYFHQWEAVDGDGQLDSGEAWLVDMVKGL